MTDRGATLDIECAGRDAFKAGFGADACPYTFNKTPCYTTSPKRYEKFNTEYRPKMDAWMRGWMNEQKRSKDA